MVSEKKVQELLNSNGNPLITITLPTHKKGEEVKQNPIRYKNLLTKVTDTLTERGMKENEIEKLLKPAADLVNKPLFWSHQDEGLAVYLSPNVFETYKLPYSVEEQTYVNNHFLITPLLPMLSLDGTFSVLAVSRKNVRLLHCTRNSITEITPEDTPRSIDEWLEVTPEKELQFHTGAGGKDAMYFGHGSGNEVKRVVAEQYFRDVEKQISDAMNKLGEPLVLVGLEDNISFYRSINSYSRTIDQKIDANPDELSNAQIRDYGFGEIKSYFLKDLYHSLDQFNEKDNEKVSNNMAEIVEATVMGKSRTIFISQGEVRWGRYDPDNHQVEFTNTPGEQDVDLMNWLAIKGKETGSNVYMLPRGEMPRHSTVAAEFRF